MNVKSKDMLEKRVRTESCSCRDVIQRPIGASDPRLGSHQYKPSACLPVGRDKKETRAEN